MDEVERLRARVEALEIIVANHLGNLGRHLGPDARKVLIETQDKVLTGDLALGPDATDFERERHRAGLHTLAKVLAKI